MKCFQMLSRALDAFRNKPWSHSLEELRCDVIGTWSEDVVRVDVVVANGGYDGDVIGECLPHLVYHHAIQVEDFVGCTG